MNPSGPSSRFRSGPAPSSQNSSADLSAHSEVSDEHMHSPSERSNEGRILAEQSPNIEILDQSSRRDDDRAIQNLQPTQGDSGDPAQPPWKRGRVILGSFLLGLVIILLIVLVILMKTGHLGRRQQPLSEYSSSTTTSRSTIAVSSHMKFSSSGNESLTSASGPLSSPSGTRSVTSLSTGLPLDISAVTTTIPPSQTLQTDILSTIQMSSDAASAAATPSSPLLPTVSRTPSMTSVLSSATGPPETMQLGTSTTVCTL